MSAIQPKYLTKTGLAKRWGVDRTTIWRWEKEGGKLPKASQVGTSGRARYAIEDVEAFEAESKAKTNTP